MQVLAFDLADTPFALSAADVDSIRPGAESDVRLARLLGLPEQDAAPRSVWLRGARAALAVGTDLRLLDLPEEAVVALPGFLGHPPGLAAVLLELDRERPGLLLDAAALLELAQALPGVEGDELAP